VPDVMSRRYPGLSNLLADQIANHYSNSGKQRSFELESLPPNVVNDGDDLSEPS
jgi:hypothetical protein